MSNSVKKKRSDFKFGKLIGEGSFSMVYLAKEINTGKEFAVKVLEKRQIIREKKQKYVTREKDVLLKIDHPFFIKLHFTFQDDESLYFGLSFACNGELLDHIKRLGKFNLDISRFYSAEIVLALEYLHSINIIHRDLKPENILLNKEMHIQITDFGSARILSNEDLEEPVPLGIPQETGENSTNERKVRRHSFVGTAQYVSPEVLNSNFSCFSSDLWALGCMLYQFITGNHPFSGSHEYMIFQKILHLQYNIPADVLDDHIKHLIQNLLVLDRTKRLGCVEMGGYASLKGHPFFASINWEELINETPPLQPGEKTNNSVNGVENGTKESGEKDEFSELLSSEIELLHLPTSDDMIDSKSERLKEQERTNEYHKFVDGHIILKQGYLYKRRYLGLIPRYRMFLLTEGPHLYYVDDEMKVLKGEVPWTKDLRPEVKSFKIIYLHTPNRIYYLEDPSGNALKWSKKIEEVSRYYFSSNQQNYQEQQS